MIINRRKVNVIGALMIITSLFITSYYIRSNIIPIISDLNLVFLLGFLILFLNNIKRIDWIAFFYVSLIAIWILISQVLTNNLNYMYIIKNIVTYIIPLYFISLNINKKDFNYIISIIIKAINFFIILMFIIGILDIFLDFNIMKLLGRTIVPELEGWIIENAKINSYRYTSFMGHALFTKELFYIFYLINTCYFSKYKKYLLNKYIVLIVSFIGILITGSKSGIILISCMIAINIIFSNKRTFKIVISIFTLIIMYFCGIFNNIIYRFKNESLTTGRLESWEILKRFEIFKASMFTGYGGNLYSIGRSVVNDGILTAALEYPWRISILQYGIFISILILILILIYPCIVLLRKREYYIAICIVMLFIETNTYNGLLFKPDNMIFISLTLFILLGLGKQKIN